MNLLHDITYAVGAAAGTVIWALIVGLAIGFVLVTVSNPWMGL